MRVRVTIEYDYEDPDAWDEKGEANHWVEGGIDVPTLNEGKGCNCTVKAEVIIPPEEEDDEDEDDSVRVSSVSGHAA